MLAAAPPRSSIYPRPAKAATARVPTIASPDGKSIARGTIGATASMTDAILLLLIFVFILNCQCC